MEKTVFDLTEYVSEVSNDVHLQPSFATLDAATVYVAVNCHNPVKGATPEILCKLLAIDTEHCTVRWSVPLIADGPHSITARPVIVGNHIYICTNRQLVAINTETGEVRWAIQNKQSSDAIVSFAAGQLVRSTAFRFLSRDLPWMITVYVRRKEIIQFPCLWTI